jgi:hypothetical protein
MASRLSELELYKKENERDKENTLVLSKGDARTTNDLIEQAKNNLSRIEDLEGQLLSLYYVHQHQKEFEAEEEAEDELRKRELKEQEKKDLEFVKRLESKEKKKEQLEQQLIDDEEKLDDQYSLQPDGGRASNRTVPKKGRRKTTGGVLSWMFRGKKRNETTRVSPVNGRSRKPHRLPVTNAEKIDNENFVFSRNSNEEKIEEELLQETKDDFTGDQENVDTGNGCLKSIILTFVATAGPYENQSFYHFLGGKCIKNCQMPTVSSRFFDRYFFLFFSLN